MVVVVVCVCVCVCVCVGGGGGDCSMLIFCFWVWLVLFCCFVLFPMTDYKINNPSEIRLQLKSPKMLTNSSKIFHMAQLYNNGAQCKISKRFVWFRMKIWTNQGLWNFKSWCRHQMETFSALQAICAGNSPVTGEFPARRPVTRSFDVFFDLRLNKWLRKQSWGWWFETPSRP